MKNICVPTNFSETADQALATSVKIAEGLNAKITLLHLLEGEQYVLIRSSDPSENVKIGDVKLLNQVIETQNKFKFYEDKYKGIAFDTVIAVIDEDKSMAEVIDNLETDLVISGTKVINGYGDDLLIGENTRLLIKKCKVPVITLRDELKDFKMSKPVFATNFKESHFELIKTLSYFFEAFGAKLTLLYVATPDSFATTRKLTKVFKAMKSKYQLQNIELSIYNDTSKGEGVLNYVEDNEIDFVIMPTQGRTGIDYFLNSSIAEQVLDKAEVPVMTILNK